MTAQTSPAAAPPLPAFASIDDWCRLSGMGRRVVYDKLGTGELRAVKWYAHAGRCAARAGVSSLVSAGTNPADAQAAPHWWLPAQGECRGMNTPLPTDAVLALYAKFCEHLDAFLNAPRPHDGMSHDATIALHRENVAHYTASNAIAQRMMKTPTTSIAGTLAKMCAILEIYPHYASIPEDEGISVLVSETVTDARKLLAAASACGAPDFSANSEPPTR